MPRNPPYTQRRGDRWRGWASVGGHRLYSPWVDDPQVAYRAALQMRKTKPDGITLADAAAAVIEEAAAKRTRGTVRWYSDHLEAIKRSIGAETPLHRITPAMLEETIRERLGDWAAAPDPDREFPGRHITAATVNADLRALHRVFVVAIRRGWADTNPVRQVDRPRADRSPIDWFTEDELSDLLRRVTDTRACDLFTMFALTGVRRAEASRLTADHIRSRLGQVVVPGKTAVRVIPIAADLDAPIARLLSAANGGAIFAGVAEIDRVFRAWNRSLGERRLHPHALRHTFGTSLVRAGVRVDVVMRLMGHRSISTTLRYVHEVGGDGIDAVGRLRLLPRAPDREQGG